MEKIIQIGYNGITYELSNCDSSGDWKREYSNYEDLVTCFGDDVANGIKRFYNNIKNVREELTLALIPNSQLNKLEQISKE